VSHAIFNLPSVWWCNQQTIADLVLRPKPRNHHGDFVWQVTKLQLLVLRPKSENTSKWFWGQTTRTVATYFEAKPRETVNLGFEAKPRNPHFLTPCAQCRPHTASPDLSIVRPPNTRHVLDHPQSSTPSLLLLPQSSLLLTVPHLSPTHHETSKCVSSHETDSREEPLKFPRFKLKPRQVNYSSQIKPRYWQLGFSISPLMSTFTTERHKVWISNPRPHEAQLEDEKPKKLRKVR
jgi:hypothetical protein